MISMRVISLEVYCRKVGIFNFDFIHSLNLTNDIMSDDKKSTDGPIPTATATENVKVSYKLMSIEEARATRNQSNEEDK